MRGFIFYITLALGAANASADGSDTSARQISTTAELRNRLDNLRQYASTVEYGVLMPSTDNVIVYNINLQSAAATDSLSPCSYLISWMPENAPDTSAEFTSYDNGVHFRYYDKKLTEYHADIDPKPFSENGGRVQSSARFTNLLPTFLAKEIEVISNDSTYTYTLTNDATFSGIESVRIDAVEEINGYIARELTYVFDAKTGEPLHLETKRNPGSVAELLTTIDYREVVNPVDYDFSEEAIVERFPDVFNGRNKQKN